MALVGSLTVNKWKSSQNHFHKIQTNLNEIHFYKHDIKLVYSLDFFKLDDCLGFFLRNIINQCTYFFKTISEAPFVNSRNPPPCLGITVLIDFLTELKVYTRVNASSGTSSLHV